MNRRDLLKTAGGAMASLVPSAGVRVGAPSDNQPAMTTLSTYMAEAARRPLPDAVVEKTKHMILDTLRGDDLRVRTAAGKVRHQLRARVRRRADRRTVAGIATSSADRSKPRSPTACSRTPTRPTTRIRRRSRIPAARSCRRRSPSARSSASTDTRFLRAVALGYDIGPRVHGDARQAAVHGRDAPQHARARRARSASRGRGRVRRRPQRAADALGALLHRAAGVGHRLVAARHRAHREGVRLRRHAGAQRRHRRAARRKPAAPASTTCCRARTISSWRSRRRTTRRCSIDKLGERYEITRTNIKKWTVGAPIQAPLDALEILIKKHNFDRRAGQQVVVRVATNEAKIVNNREIPDICLQHMMAVMLVDRTVTFKSAHDKARMKDAAMLQAAREGAARRRRGAREASCPAAPASSR